MGFDNEADTSAQHDHRFILSLHEVSQCLCRHSVLAIIHDNIQLIVVSEDFHKTSPWRNETERTTMHANERHINVASYRIACHGELDEVKSGRLIPKLGYCIP